MKDTKDLIVNEHLSNKPLIKVMVAILGGLLIAALVMFIGLACLAFAYWLVIKNPDMTVVVWVCVCLGSAGIIQWLTCFLTSRK